ncbi:MAG: hypothetical protein ACBZ72_14115 [Candidatus Bathyarchaeia archaeon]|jgi:hypothetical protein
MSTQNFITANEVANQLNAAGVDSSGNYTVFGLAVSQTCFQAHVDYANLYVNSLVGQSRTETDEQFNWAKMSALNLACLRVLVAASGGLLLGAFDYRLGDLFITKGSASRLAFEIAVQGFRNELVRVMVNFTVPAQSVNSTRHIPHYRGPELNP